MEKSEGHFGDRAKLLLDLLAWGDEALKLGDLLARVTEAPTGVQALERMVEVHATYSPRIDALARILEAHQCQDPAVAPQLIGISRPAGSRRGSLRLRAALRLPSSGVPLVRPLLVAGSYFRRGLVGTFGALRPRTAGSSS